MCTRILISLLSTLVIWSPQAVAREWNDSSGTFSVEAELVDFKDGEVRLKKANGKTITVPLRKLSRADREFVKAQTPGKESKQTVRIKDLAGKPKELAHDDNKMAGKRSIAGAGHAVRFEVPDDSWYLTSVRIHGSRYGYPKPPKENFHVWLCDEDFKVIVDCPIPYATFQRGPPKWVTLKGNPTNVPAKFIICVGFNPEQTKGVYVSHDAKAGGNSLVALPDGEPQPFERGDWMIRATVDQLKGGAAGKSGT